MVAEWPHANPEAQYQWAQQIRFDVTLEERDVPALLALYRTVLHSGGHVQRVMEEALLTTLSRIAHPAALDFLAELLDPGSSLRGETPLAEVVEAVVDITGRSGASKGLQLLEACLSHPEVDVRDMATTGIVRACREAGYPVPEEVCQRLFAMLQNDPVRRVRFSAGLALHEAGRMELTEVIFWAEDMAGWEEDPTWAIDDDEWMWKPYPDDWSGWQGTGWQP